MKVAPPLESINQTTSQHIITQSRHIHPTVDATN